MKKWKIILMAVAVYIVIEPFLKGMYLKKKLYVRCDSRTGQKEEV